MRVFKSAAIYGFLYGFYVGRGVGRGEGREGKGREGRETALF